MRGIDPEINGKPLLPYAESRSSHAPAHQTGAFSGYGSDYPMKDSRGNAAAASGWALLDSDPAAAVAAFAAEANANPEQGGCRKPATRSRTRCSATKFRRFGRCDKRSHSRSTLHYAPVSHGAQKARIEALYTAYRDRAVSPSESVDDRFMAVAVRFMLHDYATARRDANAAIDGGDAHPTTRALADSIALHDTAVAAQ